MRDIAQKAGVSRSTVSLVLNRRHEPLRISDETCRRVMDAATSLGYRPNAIARAIATGKNRVFGFLATEPATEYVALMLAGAIEEAGRHGYLVKVMQLVDEDTDRDTVQRCIESRLAGILSVYLRDDLQEEVARFMPIARLDSSSERPLGVRITSDDITGGRMAVEHLVALGHRRIGFVGGERYATTSLMREQGYRSGMEQHGLAIPPHFICYGDWDIEKTAKAARDMLQRPEGRPTALFCGNDAVAAVVLRIARSLGLLLPNDLSVVGFANLALSRYVDPPLTTVAQPFQEMGRVAVRSLLANREAPIAPYLEMEQKLPVELIVRESTTTYP